MVGIAYQNNHDLDQPEIVNLLVTGFSGTLRGWWDSYITEESRESIKHAIKKNDEGLPIFDESIGRGIPDGVNTLIYTILKHFVGTPSNISSHDYLNNLSCPTMSEYRWYQDVFSRVMLRKDCHKPYWKEKFIDGLPLILAHKVKQELMDKNDSIDYDNLTYGDIFSTIKRLGINMHNNNSSDIKIGGRGSYCNVIKTNVLTKGKEENFNEKKSKELAVNDLQHEINIVKQEISKLKHDFKDIKSNNNNLNQGHEHKDGDESCQQALLSGKGIPDAFTNS